MNCEKCLNIIILYDNYDEVKKYISDAYQHSNGLVDFILVINKDTQKKANQLLKEFPHISLCIKDYHENIGYLNALLYSLDEISIFNYKYIILSNTDITYETSNFYEQLINKEYDENIGCIAPDVYSTLTNSHSNPHYKDRLSKKRLQRSAYIFSHPVLVPIYMKLSEVKAKKNKEKKMDSCYVYCAHGCFMILTSKFASKLKGKRYAVKMYCEEGWIAGNLRNNGMKCFYDSSLIISHNEHTTTDKLGRRRQAKLFSEALKNEINEFYKDE